MKSCRKYAYLLLSIALGLRAWPLLAENDQKVTELAAGVYAIEHKGQDGGNTTVIIGERQVLVVDSCFLPSAAKKDIAQIRRWTSKPVAFVLNTHFHNDHNFGNRIYMDAFPSATIIAHVETKKEMDRFGPGSLSRETQSRDRMQNMLASGKAPDGSSLTGEQRTEIKKSLSRLSSAISEMTGITFQSATLTFEHDFSIDLGGREVQIKYLGKGNTAGDAVAYLPKEKILAAGDLVAAPIPNLYDGYPVEWIETLDRVAQLDAVTIVPGHGPIMHDKVYIHLVRDLLKAAVDQMNVELGKTRPAMFQTLDDLKGSVDLSPFRQRFAGDDPDLALAFDDAAAHLIKLVFLEASLR